mgnify:CR=1 FL=1|jgi:hypothetical protein
MDEASARAASLALHAEADDETFLAALQAAVKDATFSGRYLRAAELSTALACCRHVGADGGDSLQDVVDARRLFQSRAQEMSYLAAQVRALYHSIHGKLGCENVRTKIKHGTVLSSANDLELAVRAAMRDAGRISFGTAALTADLIFAAMRGRIDKDPTESLALLRKLDAVLACVQVSYADAVIANFVRSEKSPAKTGK